MPMEIFIKGSGKMVRPMGMVRLLILLVLFMKENGRMIYNMVRL